MKASLAAASIRLLIAAALLCSPALATAQTPASAPQHVSETGKSVVKVNIVPSLIVINAHGAILAGAMLTFNDVSPNAIYPPPYPYPHP